MTVGECHSNLTDAVDDLKATHGKTQWILQILKSWSGEEDSTPCLGQQQHVVEVEDLRIILLLLV